MGRLFVRAFICPVGRLAWSANWTSFPDRESSSVPKAPGSRRIGAAPETSRAGQVKLPAFRWPSGIGSAAGPLRA